MGRPPEAVHVDVSVIHPTSNRSSKRRGLKLAGALTSGALTLVGGASLAHAEPAQSAAEQPMLAPALSDPPPLTLSSPEAPMESSLSGSEDGRSKPHRQFGAMFDLGVPDGAMLSFVYRPVEVARFYGGGGYNGVSPGLRLGGTFIPFGWGPAVSADYGHYFEGDANGLVSALGNTNEADSVLLQRFGYDFVNLRLGLELGGDRFTFFARGGVSWIRTTLHDFEALLDPGEREEQANTSIAVPQDPVLNIVAPGLQLGFIVQL